MALNETSEIDVLEDMRDAITHGIDANGKIAGASDTPTYGGSSASEDFYVYQEGSQISLPVYCPMLVESDTYKITNMLAPYVEITYEPMTPSMQTFNKEVRAGMLVWSVVLGGAGGTEGYLVIGGTTYSLERACMILRDRLYRIAEKLAFDDVALLVRRVAEPTGVYPVDEDRRFYRADVSIYIEYWPEITI